MSTFTRTTLGLLLFSFCFMAGWVPAKESKTTQYKYVASEEVARVWSGCSVGFTFQIHKGSLYAGWYQADQSMVIGRRDLSKDGKWETKVLPTKIKWDSHNYIAMAFDSEDILHVSGNMHAVPLIYFRADQPNDVLSLQQIPEMTGQQEKRMTYPKFMTDRTGRLLFCYRDGGSGNGNTYWNRYDVKTKKWTRLMDTALFDGQKLMNAYPYGPIPGPDGYYHLIWVWRDTPDCSTNHDLTYARSPDMVHWEDSYGKPVPLPININGGERIAAVPVKGGLLNSRIMFTFDAEGRIIITWSEYDKDGYYQVWNARREKDGWRKVQSSDWKVIWNFSGGGCLPSEATFGGVNVDSSLGCLTQYWNDIKAKKSGRWYLDPATLQRIAKPKETSKSIPLYSSADNKRFHRRLLDDPRVITHVQTVSDGNTLWVFHWETLPVNRDRPDKDGAPSPSPLELHRLEKK